MTTEIQNEMLILSLLSGFIKETNNSVKLDRDVRQHPIEPARHIPGPLTHQREERTIGPVMLQDEVEPFLDDRRRGVPIEGMLENDDIVGLEEGLFVVNIDGKIGIGGVEIVDGNAIKVLVKYIHGMRQKYFILAKYF